LVVEGRYRLARCEACRTEFFRPDPQAGSLPPRAEQESAYWEQYKFAVYASSDLRRDYERRYEHAFELAERHSGPIRSVVDVGTGIGNFLAWAEATGRAAVGVDTDPSAVATARQRGLTTYELKEFDSHVADASFDAGSMWDVIEHIYEPDPAVAQLVRKVQPGGVLLFETPTSGFRCDGCCCGSTP
jgi:2-polyprenyl-3-methyl-5-hydroxy-6-metoxy-1,4-benzoquinol methylase